MVEWSGKEVAFPYKDGALKFVHKKSPVILDARLKLHNSNAYHILAFGGWHYLRLRCQVYLILKEATFYRFRRA
jgi:hypothetical protein